MRHITVFDHPGFRFNATAVRPVLFAAAMAVALCVLAVPALSSDSSGDGAGARLAPPLVPTTAAVTSAAPAADDSCIALLRAGAPVGGRVAAAHHPRNVIPVAIIGMMTGTGHVTGPREQAVAFMPDDAAAALDGRNARAIAAYRHCRSAALMTSLSN